jgi:hypothetical protein
LAEFIFTSFPDGEIARTLKRPTLVKRLHAFIPQGTKARIREIGQDFGPWRRESDAIDRILDRVDRMGVGPKVIVQREKDRAMRGIRELSSLPDLGANPEIEKIHAAVWKRYSVRSGGLWLCRYIDGTSSVSKHGYLGSGWKGAAEDIFVNAGGMPELVKVGQFIVDQTKRGNLKAATVIVDNDIWTSGGWRVYGGQRHYHVHVDVAGGTACKP